MEKKIFDYLILILVSTVLFGLICLYGDFCLDIFNYKKIEVLNNEINNLQEKINDLNLLKEFKKETPTTPPTEDQQLGYLVLITSISLALCFLIVRS